MIRKISFYGLIVVILVALVFTIAISAKRTPVEIRTINYTFSVKDAIGFNLDADKLHFGGGPTSAILQRKLDVASTYDAVVEIETVGPGYLYSNKNDFFIAEGGNETIEFNLLITDDLSDGTYEGTIFLYFYKP